MKATLARLLRKLYCHRIPRYVIAHEHGDGYGPGPGTCERADEWRGGGDVLAAARRRQAGMVAEAAQQLAGIGSCLKSRPVLRRCLSDVLAGDWCGEIAEEPLAPQACDHLDALYVAEFGVGCGECAEQAGDTAGARAIAG